MSCSLGITMPSSSLFLLALAWTDVALSEDEEDLEPLTSVEGSSAMVADSGSWKETFRSGAHGTDGEV